MLIVGVLLSVAQAVATQAAAAHPIGEPSIAYPEDALEKGEEGVVSVVVQVSEAGLVDHCDVVRSSNSQLLDEAACAGFSKQSYTPATDASGKAVRDSSRHGVVFYRGKVSRGVETGGAEPIGNPANWFRGEDYPSSSAGKGESGRVEFTFGIAPNGQVADCRITVSSGFASLDMLTCKIFVSRAKFKPPLGPDGVPRWTWGRGVTRWAP